MKVASRMRRAGEQLGLMALPAAPSYGFGQLGCNPPCPDNDHMVEEQFKVDMDGNECFICATNMNLFIYFY
jgi:hypothetical protein